MVSRNSGYQDDVAHVLQQPRAIASRRDKAVAGVDHSLLCKNIPNFAKTDTLQKYLDSKQE